MIIGIDLDNTIIQYDALIYELAREKNFIPDGFAKNKQAIRDHIRNLREGDIEWQKIQGAVYGGLIQRAEPFEGVKNFFDECLRRHFKVFIISHKTHYASYDDTKTDLREAALKWIDEKMKDINLGGFIDRNAVFFGSTRQDKVQEIIRLKCDWFIDDLIETFLEPGFPSVTKKVLFGTSLKTFPTDMDEITTCATWKEIGRTLFQ